MKINHLTQDIDIDKWGGISQTILEYTHLLRKKGHLIKICCADIAKDDKLIHKKWKLDCILLHFIPPHLKSYDFDILHWHGRFDYLWLMAPYLIKKKIPIVISLHCSTIDNVLDINFNGESCQSWLISSSKPFWKIRKLIRIWRGNRFRRLLPQIKAFICHSHEHLISMRKYFPNHRVEYLPHGVNIDRFSKGDGVAFRRKYGIPENAFMVLTMGRIDAIKKQHFLIELLPEMLKIRPDTHLVFIGAICDLKYKIKLEKTILELKVENFVTLIPGFDAKDQDLVNAYHACDLFMSLTSNETFGIVFIEAFCAAKCTIGSRSGGVPGVITEGVTGLLYEPDNKSDILLCFKKVALNDDYRNKLGNAAKDQVYEKFSWDMVGNKLIDLYHKVIEDNK